MTSRVGPTSARLTWAADVTESDAGEPLPVSPESPSSESPSPESPSPESPGSSPRLGPPIAFAHRGAPAWYQRENTLAAFRRAIARGANGVESDVWLTADGEAVLHHDGVVGPPHRRRRIPALLRRQLPAGVPSLAEFYAAGGDQVELSLDIKDPRHLDTVRRVLAVARSAGPRAAGRLWLCGGLGGLRQWRQEDATVRLVNTAPVNEVADGVALEARLRELTELRAVAINVRASGWAAAMVSRVHEQGMLAFGWDAQGRATIRRLLGYGVDGVYSDHLARLVRLTRAATVGSVSPA